MKKFILSTSVTFLFVAYILFERRNIAAQVSLNPTTNGSSSTVIATPTPIIISNEDGNEDGSPVQPPATQPAVAPAPVVAPAPIIKPIPTPAPKGQFKDGQYTGNSVDAYYGFVQVRASISGGKLSGVTFLSYPSDRSTSREINGQAMPRLISEAIAGQTANVTIVSGATDTSQAFQQSLASALAQAGN